jgi:hypothetical protein
MPEPDRKGAPVLFYLRPIKYMRLNMCGATVWRSVDTTGAHEYGYSLRHCITAMKAPRAPPNRKMQCENRDLIYVHCIHFALKYTYAISEEDPASIFRM